jgi:cytochrome c-type biogenesis protein CcmH/NrfG
VCTQEPESYESWGNIGAVYMSQNNLEGALHAFQVIVALAAAAAAAH